MKSPIVFKAHRGPGLDVLHKSGRWLCTALVIAGSTAVNAELSEPLPPEPDIPYFNLFSDGYGKGSGALVGDLSSPTDTVWLCGTENCGPGNEDDGGYGYAEFSVITDSTGDGSGAIDPFLRLQHNDGSAGAKGTVDIEQAYNTNNDDLQEVGDVNGFGATSEIDNYAKDTGAGSGDPLKDFNHAIQASTMLVDDEGYMTFLLDINEPGTTCDRGGNNCDITSTLRIDELSFFISTTDTLSFFDPDSPDADALPGDACSSPYQPGDPVDNMCDPDKAQGNFNLDPEIIGGESVFKFWDMDWDETYAGLLTDNLNSSPPGQAGSGDFDVQMRVPVTEELEAFVNENLGELYIYLYTFMGEADDLFVSEGSVGSPTNPDPCTGPGNSCKEPDPDTGVADAGFEELAYLTGTGLRPPEPPSEVPVPSTAFLLLIGTLGLWRQRKA